MGCCGSKDGDTVTALKPEDLAGKEEPSRDKSESSNHEHDPKNYNEENRDPNVPNTDDSSKNTNDPPHKNRQGKSAHTKDAGVDPGGESPLVKPSVSVQSFFDIQGTPLHLFLSRSSVLSQALLWCCLDHKLDIEHTWVLGDKRKPSTWPTSRPFAQASLPLLVQGKRSVLGLHAVLHYISACRQIEIKGLGNQTNNERVSMPSARERAVGDQRLCWVLTKLEDAVRRYVEAHNHTHSSWLAHSTVISRAHNVVTRLITTWDTDLAKAQEQQRSCQYVGGLDNQYAYGVADIIAATSLQHFLSIVDPLRFSLNAVPNVSKWHTRMLRLPSYQMLQATLPRPVSRAGRLSRTSDRRSEDDGAGNSLQLFTTSLSPGSWCVQALCAEKHVPLHVITDEVSIEDDEDLSQGVPSRYMRLPALRDGHITISQEPAILKHIGVKLQLDLFPKDTRDRSKVDEFLTWVHNKLATQVVQELGYSSIQHDLCPAYMGVPRHRIHASRTHSTISNLIKLLDNKMLTSCDYLCGATVSLADVYLYSVLSILKLEPIQYSLDWSAHGKLASWKGRMDSLSVVRILNTIMDREDVQAKPQQQR